MKKVITILVIVSAYFGTADTHFVNVNNIGGSVSPYDSWATAATNIQHAVNAATAGDSVLVTNGTYDTGSTVTPGYTCMNRVVLNKDILLKSVNGPDVTIIDGKNSVRCIFNNGDADIEGFKIFDGRTLSSGNGTYDRSGAGVLNTGDDNIVSNCIIDDCYARIGGGIYNGTVNNCTISGNQANWGGGLNSCTANNCTITGNRANPVNPGYGGDGGGTHTTTANNCTISENEARTGGGTFYCTVNNCIISGNKASWNGGGSYQGTINNCTISENSASQAGGGTRDTTANNCTITKNKAQWNSGGVSGGTIRNSIVWDNTAPATPNYSGGTFSYSCSYPIPSGVGNFDDDPGLINGTHIILSSPCVGAGSAAYTSGTDIDGNAWLDPPAVGCDQPFSGSLTGELSVAIYAAFTSAVVGTEMEFESLITGMASSNLWEVVGEGFYSTRNLMSHTFSSIGEFDVILTAFNNDYISGISATVKVNIVTAESEKYYVDQSNPTPVFPYKSWEDAATNIQDAVDAVVSNRVQTAEVIVTNGIYSSGGTTSGRVDLRNTDLILRSVNGPDTTIIDGGGNSRGIFCNNNEGKVVGITVSNCVVSYGAGIASLYKNIVITNCVITDNRATSTITYYGGYSGGGLFGGIIAYNCKIKNNIAAQSGGGGVFVTELNNCKITENTAGINGGGTYYGIINNCEITGNSSDQYGGGAYRGTINNCDIRENLALQNGGGAYQGTINNSVLTANTAGREGGGMYDSTVNNCTITANEAGIRGGGTRGGTVHNGIIWDNEAPDNPNYYLSTIDYTCTEPLASGTGNFISEPLLTESHISINSPCIGKGSSAYTTGVDIDGDSWLDPPAVGCDQPFEPGLTGPLSVEIYAEYTSAVVGVEMEFEAVIVGKVSSNYWKTDGKIFPDEYMMSYSFDSAGEYEVILRAFNNDNLAGVAATVLVNIVAMPTPIFYVNKANGTPSYPYNNWTDAALTIQDAVNAAADSKIKGAVVIVTNGVYDSGTTVTPLFSANNRVVLIKNINLESVNGPEVTIIEGAAGVRGVYMPEGGAISGFTIRNGNTATAGDDYYDESGGGILSMYSFNVITNCIMSGNTANYYGGGILGGTISNCKITENSAGPRGGGTYYGTISNCEITENSAGNVGGGTYYGTISNCEITGNTAGRDGGGTYYGTISNCKISENSANRYGGGTYYGTINNSAIFRNTADQYGGGSYYGTLNNCTVTANKAAQGGGTYNSTLNNTICYYNSAAITDNRYGGSHYNSWETTGAMLLSPSHIASNSPCVGAGSSSYTIGTDIDGDAWEDPPAIGCDQPVPASLIGDLFVDIYAEYTSAVVGTELEFDSLISGELSSNCWEILDVQSTNFANAYRITHTFETAGDYKVILTGFNIDNPLGVSATVTVHIIEETVVGSIFYVDAANGGSEVYPYTSWATAADTIQEAVEAAETTGIAGARVIVTNGVYDSGSKAPPLSCNNRVAISKLVNLESVNGAEQTIIDGSGSMRCIYNIDNGLVSGFTITNGKAASGDNYVGQSGGGALKGNYTNCVIVNCNANQYGGGIYGGTINNCEITGNTANVYGGGTYYGTISNSEITGNSAQSGGGGAFYGTISNCKIFGNTASSGGGTYYGTINNCEIVGNTATMYDGGGSHSCTINNCTIVSNITKSTSAGVYNAALRNCIIKYNYRYNGGGATNIYNVYNCSQVNCRTSPEPGIDIDPDFVSGNDYRLKRSSTCINAGNNTYAEGEFALGGNLRILDGIVDIGCYELSILPFINITNEDAIVTYDSWVYTIGGTNNENVFGVMNWTNGLTGDSGSFPEESPWEIVDIDLEMGINTITVSGTNEFGDYTNDVITINRGGFGTGIPFIDVTNISLFVTFDETEYTIAGSNNVNVIGEMVWTNNLGGNGTLLPGDFSDPDFGPITSIPLDVGNNVITVYGTNLYDYSTNSSVTIERGIPGTGVPIVDITNSDAYVTFDTTEYSISGENNTNVVGGLVWTNALTGESGSLTHGNPWWSEIGPFALEVGENIITVYGTNLFGETVTDSVTIERGIAGTGIPFIDVTNENIFVTFDVLTGAIGGSNNANVIGMMNWTNSLGGSGTVLPGNPWWEISGISLSVGDNVIVVYGTNLNDVVTNSLVTITRGIAGTGIPFLNITNANEVTVTFDVTDWSIHGSNNANVVGGMSWANSLGGNGNLLPGNPWWNVIGPFALDVGINELTVTGTNLYNVSTTDVVRIIRGIPGTGVPIVDITNENSNVSFDVTEVTINGNNNTNVYGTLNWQWTNDLTGLVTSGTIPAGLPWWTLGIIPITDGWNYITVSGTNLLGEISTDQISIFRGEMGTGTPFIDITNVDHFVTYDVLKTDIGGNNNANVLGGLVWTNSLGGTGSLPAGFPDFIVSNVPLSVGLNYITVYGTNLINQSTNDTVIIERGIAGTGLPFIDITNSDDFVTFDVEDYIIGGTNNDNVVGVMNWTNSLGGSGTISAANSWENNPVALIPGINVIVVYGTNLNGFVTNSIINIERGEPGTGLPFINITNLDVTVDYDITTYNIGGENNTNVVGMMNWTNLNTGVSGQLLPGNPWWIVSGILLGDGLNEIIVSGTNVYNQATNDVLRITRGNVFDVILKAPVTETITNLIPIDLSVFFGAGIETGYLSTNNGADWFEYSNPVTFPDFGEYYWTAKGSWNGGADTAFAAETNKLTIIDVPEVHLITPFDLSVFTNQLSINLTPEFKSLSVLEAQLSTNNGSSWFGYDAFNPVTFPATGVWNWTARARNVAGWGYADATNSLEIFINPVTNMVFLVKPAAGAILTNENVEFSVTSLGGPYFATADTFIFDDAPTFPWTFPTNLVVSVGQHSWSGGKWIASPSQFVYAKTTNLFTVLAADEGVVELESPIDEAIYSVGWIQFFVKYLNVNSHQLSTNNGSSWFDYSSGTGLYFGEQQIIRWTARGKDTGDSWVYANSTNVLNIDTHNNNSEPTIWINNPNPQVSTTKWQNILFDGAFDVNGGLFKKLVLLTNDVIAEPVTINGSGYSLGGGVDMSHESVNEIKAILTLVNGNCATAMCVIICDTNYVAPGSVQPSINIEHPNVATTAFLNIVYDGIYSDQGGTVESFELFVNGVSTNPVLYADGMYQLSNGLDLVHDTVYNLESKITLVGGRWTNAFWTIVCNTNYQDPSTAIPTITIETPNVLTTKHQNISYEGIYKENGGAFQSLKLYRNGSPLIPAFNFNGNYLLIGGLDMLHESVNNLESIIELANGNVATASWTIVCNTNYVDPSTALPTITIENPNVLTTKWEEVAFNGMYSENGGVLHSFKLFNGFAELNPVSKANGAYELVDGLKMAHNTINELKAIIELANGNVATALWTIICNTNYIDPETATPTITIENPYALTTKFQNISFDGMYSENGGIFKSLKLFNGGQELNPVFKLNGNYILVGGLNMEHESVNELKSIIELANGNVATAMWTIVCNTNHVEPADFMPTITIDNPNSLTSTFLNVGYGGMYSANGGELKSLELFNNGNEINPVTYLDGAYELVGGLNMTNGSINNLKSIIELANGNSATAMWTIVCNTNLLAETFYPSITIENPNALTTKYQNISFDGIYSENGGIFKSLKLFKNEIELNPVFKLNGSYLMIGGLNMSHDSVNELKSIIELASGNSATATWTIVCNTNYVEQPIVPPIITIENPNVLTTKYLNVSFDGMYSVNGGVFKSLNLFNGGNELNPVVFPDGTYVLVGGLNMTHLSVNNLEAIIELADGLTSNAVWTIVCDTNYVDETIYVPTVTIDNPNVLTSAFLNISYDGTYNLNGGELKSIEAFVNGSDRLISFINGTYQIVGGLVLEHNKSYQLETVLTLADDTVTNAKWTVFCDTNAVPPVAAPFITIDNPNVLTTEYLNISYDGIYELDGGILQSIELFINGIEANPVSYANGSYLLIGGLSMQHEGIYQLEAVITLADGVSSNAIWTIVCDTNYVGCADIIEDLEIALSNDYKTTIISWSNEVGQVDIWIQTNEFYNPEGPWIVMPGGPFDTPYFHTGATNYQSCFYRVVQGGGTSRYDVGKMDSTILPGSIAWISFPFKPMDAMKTIDDWFGKQLKPMSNSGKYPIINRQITAGGSVFPLEYYIDDFGFHELGATGWFPRLPESNRQLSEMLAYILFLPDSHPAVYLTAVGMAPTNSVSIEMPRETAVPWIGLPYPTDVSMTKTVLTNLFYPPKSNLGSYDTLLYQNELGGSAASIEYYIDDFGFFELGATNFFPEHQIINPVKGYLIFYSDDDRVGNKEWICPKPY